MARKLGDDKWDMRRRIMLSVFGFCGAVVLLGFVFPPEKSSAVEGLLTAATFIVMPVLLAYLGIVETADYLKSTKVKTTSMSTEPEPKIIEEKTEVKSQSPSGAE